MTTSDRTAVLEVPIHDRQALTGAARVQAVGMGDEANRWQRSGAVGPVQAPPHKPPRGQAVWAALGGGDQTLVWAAADTVGHPLGQGVVIRWGPSAVAFELRVGATDGFCLADHHRRAGQGALNRRP